MVEKIEPDSKSVVVINADAKVEHGTVVKVMDCLRQVPGAKMAIATLAALTRKDTATHLSLSH